MIRKIIIFLFLSIFLLLPTSTVIVATSDDSSDTSSDSTPSNIVSNVLNPITIFFSQIFNNPDQLFDIQLEIDNPQVENIKDLVARVIFESFGTEPTPVELTFFVLNEKGQKVYKSNEEIVVETELVKTKEFEDIFLPEGEYTLKLTTLYNLDVKDEFLAYFRIIKPQNWLYDQRWYLISLVIIILFFLILLKSQKRKDKKEKRQKKKEKQRIIKRIIK